VFESTWLYLSSGRRHKFESRMRLLDVLAFAIRGLATGDAGLQDARAAAVPAEAIEGVDSLL
jgi:hypothetical protein